MCLEAAAVTSARAQQAADADPEAARAPRSRAGDQTQDGVFSHKGQATLHLATGLGYRAIFTYDEQYCGELKDGGGPKSNCLGRSPMRLDLGLGYGLTDKLEAMIEIGLGVETDFGPTPSSDGPRAIALAPGIKYYLADIGATMFFSTLQMVFDFTSFDSIDKNDLGVRNVNGLHLDFHRTFGAFVYFGEQVSWRRWLRFEVEAGIGAQVRFP